MFNNIDEEDMENPAWCINDHKSSIFLQPSNGILGSELEREPTIGLMDDLGDILDKEIVSAPSGDNHNKDDNNNKDRQDDPKDPRCSGCTDRESYEKESKGCGYSEPHFPDKNSDSKESRNIKSVKKLFFGSFNKHRKTAYGIGGALFLSFMYISSKAGFAEAVDTSLSKVGGSISWVYDSAYDPIRNLFHTPIDKLPEHIADSIKQHKREIITGRYDSQIRKSIDLLIDAASVPYREKELTDGIISASTIEDYLSKLPKGDKPVKDYITALRSLVDKHSDEYMVYGYAVKRFDEIYNGMSDDKKLDTLQRLIEKLPEGYKAGAAKWSVERMDYDKRERFLYEGITSLDGVHTRELGKKIIRADKDYFVSAFSGSCKDPSGTGSNNDDQERSGAKNIQHEKKPVMSDYTHESGGFISRVYKRIIGG